MKEKIYTIPVTDAFAAECECPLCVLEKRLEEELVDYMLGPSLMEPDGRAITNENGFCREHFELLYNKQVNRLGLGLMIDTHLAEQNANLQKWDKQGRNPLKAGSDRSLFKKFTGKNAADESDLDEYVNTLIARLADLENRCAICSKLDYTMDRYLDVVLYLWQKEQDFKRRFNEKKGFCLRHVRELLESTKKYLNTRQRAEFVRELMNMQLENMQRLQEEVNWFTKKFDYRYTDAPWGNSKDAVQRGIQKLVGYAELK